MITVITVPDYNDSFSRVVLAGKEYLIRFSYNFSGIIGHSEFSTTIRIRMCRESKLSQTPRLISSPSATDCRKGCLERYPQNKTLGEMTSKKTMHSLSFSQRKIF